MMTTPEPQHLTSDEINQAEIEAWLIVLRQSWATFLQAVKALRRLGALPNLCKYLSELDKIAKSM